MLDHIILTVSDIKRSLAFYETALKPLNIKFFMPYKGKDGHPDLWGFGDGKKAFFWIKQGKPDPTAIHWGFVAENKNGSSGESVGNWQASALGLSEETVKPAAGGVEGALLVFPAVVDQRAAVLMDYFADKLFRRVLS